MNTHLFVAHDLDVETRQRCERLAQLEDVVQLAVMPDVHPSGAHGCVGTVLATASLVYPGAIGGDIGCGMLAVRLGRAPKRLGARSADALLRGLAERVPVHAHRAGRSLEALEPDRLSVPRLRAEAKRQGARQLGTVGRGNHFVELQVDEDRGLWLTIHTGSRGIGQAILSAHAPAGTGLRGVDAESPAGRAYLNDLAWGLAYADLNRERILDAATGVLAEVLHRSPEPDTRIACVHNVVARESHAGRALWVHRKGAIPAAAGQWGVIPGSMGTTTYHVQGRGHPEALGSAAHGAGRRLSRGQAKRVIRRDDVFAQMRDIAFDHRRAGALREEAPSAYKDIDAVMRAQRALVRVRRRLRPILVYKGS